jgi:hypothetical protein
MAITNAQIAQALANKTTAVEGNAAQPLYYDGTMFHSGKVEVSKDITNTIVNNIISAEKLTTGNTDKMLSTANGSTYFGNITGVGGRVQRVEVDFDEAVWSIEVPGIEKDKIDVFTVADKIYVDIQTSEKAVTKERKVFQLAEDETVTGTKLELGVLKITIDRPAKRQVIEIA